METPRRKFLIGAGMAASLTLSGCVSDETMSDSNDDDAEAGSDGATTELRAQETVPAPDATSGVLLDRSVTIDGNDYIAKDFSISSETRFKYRLTTESNVSVDLFVTTTGEFVRYGQGKRITPVVLERISNNSGTFTVPQGNYYVVVDNTDRLEAEPPGQLESKSATVNIKITY